MCFTNFQLFEIYSVMDNFFEVDEEIVLDRIFLWYLFVVTLFVVAAL